MRALRWKRPRRLRKWRCHSYQASPARAAKALLDSDTLMICPTGAPGKSPVQSHLQKYFRSRIAQITSTSAAVLSPRGALAIVTNAGRDAMDAEVPLTNGTERGRRSRVVLTPRRWRQVGGGNSAGDGDNKARSPGRVRRKPLKPLRAGMPGDPGEPVVTMLVCFSNFACEAAGASSTRHSPRPLNSRWLHVRQNLRAPRGEIVEVCNRSRM